MSVQIWRAVPDSAHPANRETRLRPGGDRTIEAAIVIDLMREQDARHIDESAAVAIRRSAVPKAPCAAASTACSAPGIPRTRSG